jgi:protein TonB
METNKILSADILDIVFEGRNKEYGAYDLRKTYRRRITIALLTTVAICLLLFILSMATTREKKEELKVIADVNLKEMKQEDKKPEPPPPPPPPKTEPPKVEITKFTPPKIVKDEEVKEPPPAVEKLETTAIGKIDQAGTKDDGTVPVVEQTGTGVQEAPKEVEDYNKVFTVVQIPAEYPGGLAAWNKYLERNLNANVPNDNGAPTGRYTVVLSFIVNKEGGISEIAAENDPGYGTKEEAMRVLKKGGGWKPAVQNGRNVIYRHRQSITFQVSEE